MHDIQLLDIFQGVATLLAADPKIAILLLGMGIDEISASPVALPKIKKAIRSVKYSDAQELARKALTLPTGKEIEQFLASELKHICEELGEE